MDIIGESATAIVNNLTRIVGADNCFRPFLGQNKNMMETGSFLRKF